METTSTENESENIKRRVLGGDQHPERKEGEAYIEDESVGFITSM